MVLMVPLSHPFTAQIPHPSAADTGKSSEFGLISSFPHSGDLIAFY